MLGDGLAQNLLQSNGLASDAETVTRLTSVLLRTAAALDEMIGRRADGDWSPDANLPKFPPLVPRKAPEAPPQTLPQAPLKATVAALIAAWAAEAGTTGKALYDRERTGKLLTDFLGHNDAGRVSADDVVRWKEARLAAGRSAKTVANDIGELRPIWTWGKANRKLAFEVNPFSGLAPRTKKRARRARGPFTAEEARRILLAARGETSALLRWLPWVLCFTGARLGEVTQAAKEDVRREGTDGPWVLLIHEDGEGRTLKTAHSERLVPIHPALIAEGFLRYVQVLPPGSSLFPDVRPDKFGTRKGTATKAHGRWVRRTVGITDRTKNPAHVWRHHFEGAARRAGLPQAVTDGLLGHMNGQNESEGYGRGYRYMPDVTAPWMAKMASPLAGETAASEDTIKAA
jgi:integrase